ncbi:hypothetical protein [Nocardia fluminea]|uniref:Uncharacterized protein n=1 Tax=Nocardia fluminea TaxID=134984 RepID=A0A2N3VGV6_9NOCA|nr:hypothetical protein [Nocardia fluminea]PKV80859.1 hypothetical protein ATK86_5296 [Nocardia fluminea]
MSPLAIILQAAICGAIIIGALAYLAGLAVVDYLHPSMSAVAGIALDGPSSCTAYNPVRAETAEPCHCCECVDCAGCPTCEDPGDVFDYRRGVA